MLNEELEKRKKNFKRDKKPTIDLINLNLQPWFSQTPGISSARDHVFSDPRNDAA